MLAVTRICRVPKYGLAENLPDWTGAAQVLIVYVPMPIANSITRASVGVD